MEQPGTLGGDKESQTDADRRKTGAVLRAVVLTLDQFLPSSNEIARLHWGKVRKIRHAWTLRALVAFQRLPARTREAFARLVAEQTAAAQAGRPGPRVVIRVGVEFPPGVRRFDSENIYTKDVVDAFRGRLYRDDGPLYVVQVLKGPCDRGPVPKTTIFVEEVPFP